MYLKEQYTFPFADFAPMANGVRHAVEIGRWESDLYEVPVLLVSDLHKDATAVVEYVLGLLEKPLEWTAVTLGDMAGTEKFGSSGDPAAVYQRMRDVFGKFYFVDGNHDRTAADVAGWTNADGTPCCLDGQVGHLGAARVSGIAGILAPSDGLGKRGEASYRTALDGALHAGETHTLLTHDAPLVAGFTPAIGNALLAERVRRAAPVVHAFGHCHLQPTMLQVGETLFLNADRRVILLEPR